MERGECLEVVRGAVRVEDGTEGESVVPAAAEVGHLHAREPWRHTYSFVGHLKCGFANNEETS